MLSIEHHKQYLSRRTLFSQATAGRKSAQKLCKGIAHSVSAERVRLCLWPLVTWCAAVACFEAVYLHISKFSHFYIFIYMNL
jgi:hypothetical protein